ncbi:hypothetical protein [Pseudomonas sp. CCC2.2]|uniref:hypothetical protein n=1 Tax=Pseudomonas sp. CCC2.2 TaxID=3048605 RepID=UPI002B226EF4|nr:hypothetical protein [Pseudomonas sp. CCC2.2]MEB0149944.1 hypothetical protein [Pseudomonas sp. CCC2.2]
MTPTQSFPSVAKFAHQRYGAPVAAKSATRVWRPGNEIDAQASMIRKQAPFVCLQFRSMTAVRGRSSGLPGFNFPGSPTCAQLSPLNRLATIRGSSKNEIGAVTMQFSRTQNPSAASGKAAAHRAMAIAALHADSSLSVRVKRYNAHMEQARSLETAGGAV